MKKSLRSVLIGTSLFALLFSGCNNSSKSGAKSSVSAFTTEPSHYAREFSIKKYSNFKVLEVRDPFDTLRYLVRYVLVPFKEELPKHLPEGIVVRTPVKSIGVTSSNDAGFIARISELAAINSVAEKNYIHQPLIDEQFKKGKIADIGSAMNINAEKLMHASPQILFVSTFKDNKYGHLKQTGIPLIQISDYMENHPLGRAEWIRFFGAFFEKDALANTIFDSIANHYENLCKLTKQLSATQRPTIFAGKLYGNIWYMAGGKSYIGHFFKDAGASYLWANRQETGSFPLDFESVYQKAINADYWQVLDFYEGTYTYQNISKEYSPYSNFKAFKTKKIIFCNTRYQSYYEQGILEPEVILADLIKILHPQLLKEHQNKYFNLLK
jgi:iron complex transport system substrate-binding protein